MPAFLFLGMTPFKAMRPSRPSCARLALIMPCRNYGNSHFDKGMSQWFFTDRGFTEYSEPGKNRIGGTASIRPSSAENR
jgi:hypothetical protein